MEDRNSDNLHIHKSSEIHEGANKKKNKKKYYNSKNTSYYYYKNLKKKKNKAALEATMAIQIPQEEIGENKELIHSKINKEQEIIVEKNSNQVINKNSKNIKNNNNNKRNNNKKQIKSDIKSPDDEFIITKEFSFIYENPDDLKEKGAIKDLKQALDMYYYEEELGKFSIKEEHKNLKELHTLTDQEKRGLEEPTKEEVSQEYLSSIQPIIKFNSEPISKVKLKKAKKKVEEDFIIESESVKAINKNQQDDLIITRQINFDYDAKDLKKKKVLNELKEAIEDFDRLEMIQEINSSSESINNTEDNLLEEKTKTENIVAGQIKTEEVENTSNEEEVVELEATEIGEEETHNDEDILVETDVEIQEEKKNKDNLFNKLFKKKKLEKKDNALQEEVIDDFPIVGATIELPTKKGEEATEKYLDTQMQPLVEEDKFTQILNKIDLEENLKELAESNESSNYLAESFLNLKNHKTDKLQYEINNKKKLYWAFGIVALILVILFILIDYVNRNGSEDLVSTSYSSTNEVKVDKEAIFNACLTKNYEIEDKDDEMAAMEAEITEYVKNKYDASFIYQDITTGYSFGYNSSEIYYAASTIKLLDALYVYTKAAQGELSLDTPLVYSSIYDTGISVELDNHQYGEVFTIRELVKYAVTVSDNAAHSMLISYIGRSNLRAFGNEIGATNTLLVGGDNFGSINGLDAIAYLTALNNFINSDEVYGQELKEILVNADQPYLNLSDNIVSAHKYGHFEKNYHNIGIVYADHPYMIAILSKEGYNENRESMIRDINERIYKLHSLYYENRDTKCYVKVYMD